MGDSMSPTIVSTHSHPKVAACNIHGLRNFLKLFQHTATRRWLQSCAANALHVCIVSTHSHPKVAACLRKCKQSQWVGFNTQPPEGGCQLFAQDKWLGKMFQHTATRRWLPLSVLVHFRKPKFQHTATRRWLLMAQGILLQRLGGFNTQPPEGGCFIKGFYWHRIAKVSTHSHPKVAAFINHYRPTMAKVSTHSHPKVAA